MRLKLVSSSNDVLPAVDAGDLGVLKQPALSAMIDPQNMKRESTRAKKMNDQNESHEAALLQDIETILETMREEPTHTPLSSYIVNACTRSNDVHIEIVNLESARVETAISAALLGEEMNMAKQPIKHYVTASFDDISLSDLERVELSVVQVVSKLHAHLGEASSPPCGHGGPRFSVSGFPSVSDLDLELRSLSGVACLVLFLFRTVHFPQFPLTRL